MAIQTNNLVTLENGLSRTIGSDNATISGGLDGTPIGIATAAQGKFSSAEVVGDLTVGGDIVSGGTSDMLISDNFIDINHGLRTATNTAGGFTVNLAASVTNSLVIDAYTAVNGGLDSFVTMNVALVRAQASTTVIADAVAVVNDTVVFPSADGSTFSMIAVAAAAVAGQFNVGADIAAQTDAIKAGIDLLAGTPYATAQGGGPGTVVTVTATAGNSFTDGHSLNGKSMTAGFAIISAAFAGGAGLSKGDIVQVSDIAGAGVAASNAGVFQVSGIPSTTKVEFARAGTVSTQVPFCQNNLETSAVLSSGMLSGLDLSALAFSEGTLADVASVAIPKGLLCQAYSLQANISTWAWESAGNVSLQEAYGVGKIINIDNGDLIFNAQNAADGDFQVTAPGGDALFVDGTANETILGSAGAVKIDFAGYSKNDLTFDTGKGATTLASAATSTLDIRAQGSGAGQFAHTLDVDADTLTMNAIVDMDIDLTVDTTLGNQVLSISAGHDNAGNKADILVESTDGDVSITAFTALTQSGSLQFHHTGLSTTSGIIAGRVFKMSGSMLGDAADAQSLAGIPMAGVAQASAAPAAALTAYVVHGGEALIDVVESHDVGYFNIVDNAQIGGGDSITLAATVLTEGVDWAKGGGAAATGASIVTAINLMVGYESQLVGDRVLVLNQTAGPVAVALATSNAAGIAPSAATMIGVDQYSQTGVTIAGGQLLYLTSSTNPMGAFHGTGMATNSGTSFGAGDSVMRVGLTMKSTFTNNLVLSQWQPQFIANIIA